VKRRTLAILVQCVAVLLIAASCPINNVRPLASFTFSPAVGSAPLTVRLDASGSCDSGGSIVSYSWRFSDGTTASGVLVEKIYSSAGTYMPRLTVTDNDGATNSTSRAIEILPPVIANSSPIASFAVSPTAGQAPLEVSFDASGSSDSDGNIVSYIWSFGDGEGASGIGQRHTYSAEGSYSAQLTIRDDDGAIDTRARTIRVSAAIPVLDDSLRASLVAVPTSGQAPLTVSFDGSGSSDPDGTIVSYVWSFGDGEGSSDMSPIHDYTLAGTYTAQLTVTDDEGATASASQTVRVSSPPAVNCFPAASFAASPTSGLAPMRVSFDASSSSDADGSIVSYLWSFGDGEVGSGVTESHTYSREGTYTAQLTVRDNEGATHRATRKISIIPVPNAPPIASFTASPLEVQAGSPISFDASGSSDSDGVIAAYMWSFGDGGSASGATVSRTYNDEGTYTVRLTTVDDAGATDSATQTINVLGPSVPNVPPAASFTASPTLGEAPLDVQFNASASADSDGSIVSYAWTFGDSSSSSGRLVSHTYSRPRPTAYTVELTVTDDDGATDSTSQTIQVVGPSAPNIPPIAFFEILPSAGEAPLDVNLNASSSWDPDGTIVSCTWNFGDGEQSSGCNVWHTFNSAGTYTFKLTVTDDDGATGTAIRPIDVSAPPH